MAKWLPGNNIWAVKMSSVEVYDSNNVQHPIFNNMTFFFPSVVYGHVASGGTYIVTPDTVHAKLRECGFIGTEFATPYIVTRTTPTGEAAQLISLIPQIFPLWKGHIAIPNATYICNRDTSSGIVTNCFFGNNFAYGQGFDGSIGLARPALMGFYGMIDESASAELWIPAYSSPDSSTVFASMYLFKLWMGTNYNLYLSIIGGFSGNASSLVPWKWWNALNSDFPIVTPDPYSPGGPTGPGGGGGTGPEGIINDDIDFPTQLSISASNANFISIWTPTLDQVQTLAKWMWTTDPLKWEFWQKLLQNPLDLIFSLTIMPVPIHHPDEGGTATEGELVAYTDSLSLGWQDTGIRMDWVAEQYVTIDMGTINLEEVWGAFLDYEPYTKIDIFLPYIGTKQLDTNDCMPRSISLRYVIDLATGTCVALIKCDNSVYYHFSGNCASQIPITVNQCQEIVRGLMTMAVGAATFAIGGPMGAGAHASKAAIAKGAAMKAGGAAMVGSGADSAAKGVNVSRSGVIGAAAGLMDVQTPYLIISRPRQAVPEEQNKYTGYPSFITEQIGDLTGYTEVQMIHLHNMSCTDEEYKEIDSLLTQGVII